MTSETAEEEGMVCGGSIDVLLEVYDLPPNENRSGENVLRY